MNFYFKNRIRNSYFILLFIIASPPAKSQTDSKQFWKEENELQSQNFNNEKKILPDHSRALNLDLQSMKFYLQSAQDKNTIGIVKSPLVIHLPMPDGTWERFHVVKSPVMHPDLAAAYPFIKTYAAIGIDDPTSNARLDITLFGFHSMILSSKGISCIEPTDLGNTSDYICYNKKNSWRNEFFPCHVNETIVLSSDNQSHLQMRSSGTQLRTYRLALACTGEYAAFYGGTKAGALSGMATTINRCNGVFEQELSISLMLIPNDTSIIYTNAGTDPYTNGNVNAMLTENQNNLTTTIGSSNYDIGHVFGTGSGGVAGLSSVCSSGSKAKGVTGSILPMGDAFDIDYVTHEFGHQFGARHTFNSVTGSCGGGNRNGQTAYEPGSGITVMAYAGICGTDNLAAHSIPYFHTISFDEITNYTTAGTGNACPLITGTGNAAPTITTMGSHRSIPISTPFVLTGSAIDSNQDVLTYSWEEFDLGPGGAWNLPSSTSPLFRSFSPTTSSSRTIPQISDILNNTTTVGELLPSVPRILKFRLTVRDHRIGGGGVMHPDTTLNITVANNGGAFAVVSPNSAIVWGTGTTQTITWNVSGTTNPPINCANVKISLSFDGGYTFPTVLSAITNNDGMEMITIPNTVTTQARIKVEAIGNIFFDVSNSNFIIQASSGTLATITTNDITDKDLCVGTPLTISFIADAPANSGNVFTAQLSNAAGFFSSPFSIGTLLSENSGTIYATIPSSTLPGSGYKVRVVSSDPVATVSDNGSSISIFGIPGAAGTVNGPNVVCQGQTGVIFSVDSIVHATTYAWTLPARAVMNDLGNSNSLTVTFSSSASQGLISVKGTNAGCDGIASPGLLVAVDSLPSVSEIISGPKIVCQQETEVYYSIPRVHNATGYSWTLPTGAFVTSGANTNSITAGFSSGALSGPISVVGTNGCGSGLATADFEVSVNRNPAVSINTSGTETEICPGASVALNFIPEEGIGYQWRKDGNNIPGATASTYSAGQTGNYDVMATSSTLNPQTFSNYSPRSIPDNRCTNAAIDSILVYGYSGMIASSSIKIRINIIHSWVGDLDVILETPNGNKLGLSQRAGTSNNSGDHYINTVFSDSGNQSIPVSGAPYTGTYQPWYSNFVSCITTTNSSFGSLGGGFINPNGTWKLHVYDRAAQDTGHILNWSILLPSIAPSICNSVSNIIPVTVIDSPVINGFFPASGETGSLVTFNGNYLNTVTSVLFNESSASFEIIDEHQLSATIPETATTGFISISNSCSTIQNIGPYEVLPFSVVALNLKLFLQCYYLGNGMMASVADPGNHPDVCDSVVVDLRSSLAPYPIISSAINTINLTGNGIFHFSDLYPGYYYVVIRHRQSMETWTNRPVFFNSTTVSFDFTNQY